MAGASLTAALMANLLIGIIKTIVGIITGSSAMISEAYHSFADTFNQILLALGIRRSKREPDLEHPFGYSKVQFFWAFIVAILIFGISGTLALTEGLEIIRHPNDHELKEDLFFWNILVLLAAICLESFAFRQAYKEAKTYKDKFGSESIVEAIDEMQDPVVLSLLVEDSLALTGLVIALIGVTMTSIFHNPIIDGYTSLAIGILLMIGGLLLARENKRYLVGKAVNFRIQKNIVDIVEGDEHIASINSMKTMLLGPKDMILALDVQFTEEAEAMDLGELIDALEKKISSKVKMLTPEKIFIEVQ